jgi:hypothetical protein
MVQSRRLPLLLLVALAFPTPVLSSVPVMSHIYVTTIPCSSDSRGRQVDLTGPPEVSLYDQAALGKTDQKAIRPTVTVTAFASDPVTFHFDIAPGFYDAFFRFPASTGFIGRNGPLIVISGKDRHLVVAACNITSDWHARGVMAGLLRVPNVMVSVLVFEHSMKCGDDYNALDQKTLQPMFKVRASAAAVDEGAYYANFYGWGQQDGNLALRFSGALFTEGAILVTNTPDTRSDRLPFLRKDITEDIVIAAMRANGKLACVDGF